MKAGEPVGGGRWMGICRWGRKVRCLFENGWLSVSGYRGNILSEAKVVVQ